MISSSKEYEPLTGRGNVNTIIAIFVHNIISQRRFFPQFVGTVEPSVEELLPPGDPPPVQTYPNKFAGAARGRLPKLKQAPTGS